MKITQKIKNIFKAFSLLELMFSIVAISVFLAAFAPVIANRYSSEYSSVSGEDDLITSQDCDINFPNPYGLICTMCYGEERCVTCGGNCPAGKKINKAKCTCE